MQTRLLITRMCFAVLALSSPVAGGGARAEPQGTDTAQILYAKKGAGVPAAAAAWDKAPDYVLTHTTGHIDSPSDCSAKWRGLWNETALYLRVDVTDDVKKDDSTVSWDDDAVEVYLDPDHDGGAQYDANDRQIIFPYDEDNAEEGAGRNIHGVTFGETELSRSSYRIVASIPWSAMSIKASSGDMIGIDVHVDDDDDGGARDGKVMWNDASDAAWSNPSVFGAGKLMPK